MWKTGQSTKSQPKFIKDTEMVFGRVYKQDGTFVTLIKSPAGNHIILQISGEHAGSTYNLGGGYNYELVSEDVVISW